MPIDVFLSVGRTTPAQEEFVVAVEDYLHANDLNPRTVGRSDFTSQQPLLRVQELMRECSGAVIIAYERLFIREGLDRRGSEVEEPIAEVALPTVWNQIEAAMAYVLARPLLMIVERGLRQEGLLEQGYDWYVQRLPLTPRALADREFRGIFEDWKARVRSEHGSRVANSGAH